MSSNSQNGAYWDKLPIHVARQIHVLSMSLKSVSESILRPRQLNHGRTRGVSFYGYARGGSSSRSDTPSRTLPENSIFRETNGFPYTRPQSDLLYHDSSSTSLSEYLRRRPRSEVVLEAVSRIHERMMSAKGPREEPFPNLGYRHPSFQEPCPISWDAPRDLIEDEEYETIGVAGKIRHGTTY